MKFLTKIKNKFSKKDSKISAIITPGMSGAQWSNRDYINFSKETYMKNLIAYKSISEVARAVSSVPWKIKSLESDGTLVEINEHIILDLFKRPNPEDGLTMIIYKIIAYLLIAGNSYIERVTPDTGPNKDDPKEIYVHRPDRMNVYTDDYGVIRKYTYTTSTSEVSWDVDPITKQSDILHLKLFHPLDDLFGLAPTEPVAREIDTQNEAIEWNKKILENECRPGMIFNYDGALSPDQFEKLREQLKVDHSGSASAGANLIIEGGATSVVPYGWSPAEMDWINSNRELARNISNAYGVPPMLIGIPGDNTYSNYKEARLAFWEETVFFYLNYLKTEFNNWFFTKEEKNLFLGYILDSIPALAPRRDALWERANTASFLSTNEKRKMVGFEETEGGDEILIPATLIPLTMSGFEDETGETDTTNKEKEALKQLIDQGFAEDDALEILGVIKEKIKDKNK